MSKDQRQLFRKYRSDYATHGDFCRAFARNTKVLYLLAFLLTANHRDAERCFCSVLERGFKSNTVFKGWVMPWIRRTLIIEAGATVFEAGHRDHRTRDPWFAGQDEFAATIASITGLPDLERFVFVMLFLERYSIHECSLLLQVSPAAILECRASAWRNLPKTVSVMKSRSGGIAEIVEIAEKDGPPPFSRLSILNIGMMSTARLAE